MKEVSKETLILGSLAVVLVGAALVSQFGIQTGAIVIGISIAVAVLLPRVLARIGGHA